MNVKKIIKYFLLLFIAISVIILIKNELITNNNATIAKDVEENITASVIAYYFHGTARCPTCKKIESYAHEAINTGFPEEVLSGDIEWRTINLEKSENNHFINDYALTNRTVVLAKFNKGRQTDWKNLNKVWSLVSDKDSFVKYIQDETRSILGE